MLVDLVHTTTRDDIRLDGVYHAAAGASQIGVDGFCLIHGSGSNFYTSTLLEGLAERLARLGCGVVRANTRGHDWISMAVTSGGGKRLGAAYEIVDECRHDLAAWIGWLRERAGPRIALAGHSLGALKCLYAATHEPRLGVERVLAISPPCLSYSRFCQSPSAGEFLETYGRADQLCQAGRGSDLIEIKLPLPFVITAAGYVEKYGPDERYNLLRFVRGVPCPALFTFGGQELRSSMAFAGLPEELAGLRETQAMLACATIADADHFYTGKRPDLFAVVEKWLTSTRE